METMENGTICGLPGWIGIARNDTVACINEFLLAIFNGSFATFAFLSNLVIIVAVVKTPSLQKPSNILLCGLAFTDCLTGITAQPMFVVWRFFLQRAQRSCSHQLLILHVFYNFMIFTVGLSLTYFVIISFDRLYALSRPLVYRANATKQKAVKTVILTSIIWLVLSFTINFILPPDVGYAALIVLGVSFIGIPVVNHIRMLFAIRLHNRQMGDALAAQQMAAVLSREKKVAINMCVVAIILLASLVPSLCMKFFEMQYPQAYAIAFPWSITVAFMTSFFNPVFYLTRNLNLRNAVKTLIKI